MNRVLLSLLLLAFASRASGAPPIYLWHEAEWFDGVSGGFAYWVGPTKATGKWGIAGPGISAEWTQGGESEWNSMGASAEETRAECHRDLIIPRAGKYRVWVRYVDHRKKKTPFRVVLTQDKKTLANTELGVEPVVPINDEYQLFWGFSFGWGSFQTELPAGTVRLKLLIDRAGEAWRQIDAVLTTDDLTYEPIGREKPPFAYLSAFGLRPADGKSWRGQGTPAPYPPRPKVGNRDFTMWVGVDGGAKWWNAQKLDALTLRDVFYQLAPPPDIKKEFHKRYPTPADTPLINFPHLLPGVYLGTSPDLSPTSGLRKWLEKTRTPFHIMTNYATPAYTDKTGPATYEALTGPLAEQFLGYIHGEALGTVGVNGPATALGKTRAEHLAGFGKYLEDRQAQEWSKFYKTKVPATHRTRSIPCLSVDSTALSHFFHESGCRVVGYEEDATNVHIPMRIAFQRGAARQYGGAWINYASGNFGDACNYFTQEPRVPRGAKSWFHSKYAVTDGVTAVWYRKMYYLNYLGGASAIYWEQNLENQWILPGPGTHPVQLSPFGRGTEDFHDFVTRLPDRGEPLTPIAILLPFAHGYEPVNYQGKMLHFFPLSKSDIELRELFNVCWHPTAILEGKPAAPDVQSMPSGIYGDIFDVLVDRPEKADALFAYPIVMATGEADLVGMGKKLEDYVAKGGTLVVNIEAAKKLPATLVGLVPTGTASVESTWRPEGGKDMETVPFSLARVTLKGAKALAFAGQDQPLITRFAVSKGAVLVTLVPHMVGQDERAHPALPWLMNGLTEGLLPVEVRLANGTRLGGELMFQVNRTRDGLLVTLINNQGVDKTQHGVARVDRRRFVDAVVRTTRPIQTARELTQPRMLSVSKSGTEVTIRVHPGDVQVVQLRQ